MVKTKVLSALAFPSLCYSIQASYANLLILMEPSDQLEPLTAEEQEEKEQLLEEVNITCNTSSSIFHCCYLSAYSFYMLVSESLYYFHGPNLRVLHPGRGEISTPLFVHVRNMVEMT